MGIWIWREGGGVLRKKIGDKRNEENISTAAILERKNPNIFTFFKALLSKYMYQRHVKPYVLMQIRLFLKIIGLKLVSMQNPKRLNLTKLTYTVIDNAVTVNVGKDRRSHSQLKK